MVHTADVHLESLPRQAGSASGGPDGRACHALKALVDLSLSDQADVLLIAGDLFEHNRVAPALVEFALQELRRAAVPVLILPGNHDCLTADSVYRRVSFSDLAPNVRVFTASDGECFSFPDLDLGVWGRPLTDYGGSLRPLAGIPPRGGERWQIAMVHGYYVGAAADAFYSFQVNDDDIAGSQRNYVALGHWPGFRCVCEGPVQAFYSGSPLETGTVTVVDFADDSGAQVHCRPLASGDFGPGK